MKVYFASLAHITPGTSSDVFPYGVACIAAYAKNNFGEALDCEVFTRPDDLNDRLEEAVPDVLCLSNYTWNKNLGLSYARHVKALSPSTIIVMGGPNISVEQSGRKSFLIDNPCVDFYVKWDGEEIFTTLLAHIADHDFCLDRFRASAPIIDSVLYLNDGDLCEGTDSRVDNFADLPSPYLMGLMDKFFDDPHLGPIIETTRGCPYGCTFCVDSHATRSKIKRRTPEFIAEELEYIASRMTSKNPLTMADLNFGMFKNDIDTAHVLASVIKKYDWPGTIIVAHGKAHPERVFEAVEIINQHKPGVLAFGGSLQSTDPEVLGDIKRKNLSPEKMLSMVKKKLGKGESATLFNELILGLPRDTKVKHFQSLRDCIDRYETTFLNVHQLAMLDGAPMSTTDQRKAFGLETRFRVFPGRCGWYRVGTNEVGIAEIEEVVISNNGMDFQDWLECRVVNLFVKIYFDDDAFCEIFGLLRRLGHSPFDVVLEIAKKHLSRFPGLSALTDDYIRLTTEKLYVTREEILDETANRDSVAAYIEGKRGVNEMIVCRGRAFKECFDELHAALEFATIENLKSKNALGSDTADFVQQLVRFSKCRKFNLSTLNDEIFDRFEYDLISAQSSGFQVLPSDVRINPTDFKFYYDADTQREINDALDRWFGGLQSSDGVSPSDIAFGRFYQKCQLENFSRAVTPA
jgi:hypothetical protein